MPSLKRPTNADVIALLTRYRCPTPFHAVRARFMGCIASPLPDRSPLDAVRELWCGDFPRFDAMADLNGLLQALITGLWNRLTAHQIERKPFRLTRLTIATAREAVLHHALVRKQEIEGFLDGLFGSHEGLPLPGSAGNAVEVLGEVRAMLTSAAALLEDAGRPAAPTDLAGLSNNLKDLTLIVETEMNTVILSCTRARREGGARIQQPATPIN